MKRSQRSELRRSKSSLKQMIVDTFKEFGKTTTLHGISFITNKNYHWSETILWLVVVIFANMCASSLIIRSWVRYNENPIVISMEKNFREWEVDFPAITGCFVDRINLTKAHHFITKMWKVEPNTTAYDGYMDFLTVVTNASYNNIEDFRKFAGRTEFDPFTGKLLAHIWEKLSTEMEYETSNDRNMMFFPVRTELGFCYTYGGNVSYYLSSKLSKLPPIETMTCNFETPLCGLRLEEFPEAISFYIHSPYEIADFSSTPFLLTKEMEVGVHFNFLEMTASPGNLINTKHVLTTCRAVASFDLSVNEAKWSDLEQTWITKYEKYPSETFKIFFCSLYLWEERYLLANDGNEVRDDLGLAGGVRKAVDTILHPTCTPQSLLWDSAIIVLAIPISPLPPYVGFMPIHLLQTETVRSVNVPQLTNQRNLCYVASFGKGYINNRKPYTLDYKVRYRAYYAKWDGCRDHMKFICKETGWDETSEKTTACDLNPNVYPYLGHESDFDQLMCFETRAKVGSVCDHDRGAPLVCNGDVMDIRWLRKRQRKCRFTDEPLDGARFYSYNYCMMTCRKRIMKERCGCAPYFYPEEGKICDVRGMICVAGLKEEMHQLMKDPEHGCSCYPNCEFIRYRVSRVRHVQWKYPAPCMIIFQWSLEVFTRTRTKRDIIFGTDDLLVSFGGIAALFLGCSVISFVEFVNFFTLRWFWKLLKK